MQMYRKSLLRSDSYYNALENAEGRLETSEYFCSTRVLLSFYITMKGAPSGEARAMIFDDMKELSKSFGATHLLGHNLTAPNFKSALESSPWIHYHGHA
jgi:hypothetical protein